MSGARHRRSVTTSYYTVAVESSYAKEENDDYRSLLQRRKSPNVTRKQWPTILTPSRTSQKQRRRRAEADERNGQLVQTLKVDLLETCSTAPALNFSGPIKLCERMVMVHDEHGILEE